MNAELSDKAARGSARKCQKPQNDRCSRCNRPCPKNTLRKSNIRRKFPDQSSDITYACNVRQYIDFRAFFKTQPLMEFLAVILGIAGLVWGAVLLKRGGLLGGCLAVMLAGACFGVEFFKIPLGAVPLTADRLLLVILVGQYLVWRRFGWTDPKPLGKPEILLCLFTGMMIASTFLGDFTATNYQPVSWLIIYYLMPFALYWIARQSKFDSGIGSEREAVAWNDMPPRVLESKMQPSPVSHLFSDPLRCLFLSLTVFGVYLSITAILEHYEIWWAVFPRYIAETAAKADAEFVGRARGPFLHPIGNGFILAVCFGASLMLWPRLSRMKTTPAHSDIPPFRRGALRDAHPQRLDGRRVYAGIDRRAIDPLELADTAFGRRIAARRGRFRLAMGQSGKFQTR
jgi:hypothetical protein